MPKVSPLDPDFLLIALPFAAFIDILDFVFDIGTVVNLLLGGALIWWFAWRTGQQTDKRELKQKLETRQQQKRTLKTAAKRALKRGLFAFILELIPIVNLIPFWLIFVLSALKEQPESKETPQMAKAEA
ncbi:MAG: hypothetical protein V1705_00290 [bacterium]